MAKVAGAEAAVSTWSMLRLLLPISLVGVGAVLAAVTAAQILPHGVLRYIDVPAESLPLSEAALPVAPELVAPAVELAMLTSPELPGSSGPPIEVDSSLLETTAVGLVPRIGTDGRTSLRHYARPALSTCIRPCVGIVVTGLGLAAGPSTRALNSPAAVGLSFSPYADAADWQARARQSGHEALLDLPLQPVAYPQDDSGPLTVRITEPPPVEEGLLTVLATGQGYVAVTGEAGEFAANPAAFAPIARILHARGLGFIELAGAALGPTALAEGLPFVEAGGPVDVAGQDGDHSFEMVEAEARRMGRVLAFVQPTPVGLDRLDAWLSTLPAKGLQVVPPSILLDEARRQHTIAGP
ncbi:MAG: divergent polysaccharide deacetylase family protein [Geminicoccaceae bacterium]